MSDWLTLLADDVRRTGSKSQTARKIGISRSAVSLLLDGKYTADTAKMAVRIVEALAGKVACPHDRAEIDRPACVARASSPMPMSSPAELRAWTACQSCPFRPKEDKHAQ